MGTLFAAALLSAGVGLSAGSANGIDAKIMTVAGDCSGAAAQVAAQTGGQVLSAQPSGAECVITVLVPGEGGPPKKMTVRVPM
ncbi:hypothetical protein [Rhizobium sp. L1K21]|uniref:hypothetical protein n=1 Tax=Rhizobium sp. L1K21 TaxID=2954933 RepID=UPI002093FEE9|nr:hypothetical protein [Rhizobium sp. L1K21]MCO6186679.1 hypothetical protein [Rhizobium sp. L1K21]